MAVTFSDAEYARVNAAAVRDGLSDAAWVGEVGVAAAAPPRPTARNRRSLTAQSLTGLRAELVDGWRVLRSLADHARRRGSGTVDTADQSTDQMLALIRRTAGRIEAVVAELDRRVADARSARLRSPG